MRRLVPLLLSALALACSLAFDPDALEPEPVPIEETDGGQDAVDAAAETDAGTEPDAGSKDAGADDAGETPDSGEDAGSQDDAGVPSGCEATCAPRQNCGGKACLGYGEGTADLTSGATLTYALAMIEANCGTERCSVDSVDGFAAGMTVLLHQTMGIDPGQWEIARVSSVDAGARELVFEAELDRQFGPGAQIVEVLQYRSIDLAPGQVVLGAPFDAGRGGILALDVAGDAVIGGVISAEGMGFHGAIAAGDCSVGNDAPHHQGGRGGFEGCGTGGGGSNARPGKAGQAPPVPICGTSGGTPEGGAPGQHNTAAELDLANRAFLGGGGGRGSSCSTTACVMPGGIGGGALFLFAKSITVTGRVDSRGNDASPGGSGGGAGGTVVLSANTIDLNPGVNAQGGNGSTCANDSTVKGGDGGEGFVILRASSVKGSVGGIPRCVVLDPGGAMTSNLCP